MAQNKLQRFEDIRTFPNVFEYPEGMKGNWTAHFKNENPITLELACGKGEYAVGLGQIHPQRNFIGVDLKGNRIWVGARKAAALGLDNVAFLRIQIDKITDFFAGNEVEHIWITFPDPQLRLSKAKKRLTHPLFLRRYQQILAPGGTINLKTDSPALYQFTKQVIDLYELEVITDIDHLYGLAEIQAELQIKTHYESLDIAGANRVHYLSFKLPKELPKEKDELLKQLIRETAAD